MASGIAELHWRLVKMESDLAALREEQRASREEFRAYAKADAERREDDRKEEEVRRTSAFRWRVATIIALLGLIGSVPAAAAIIASSLS